MIKTKLPKPAELAKDLSKLSELIEHGIVLAEASHKKIDEVASKKGILFGHVPGDVSDELILSSLRWDGICSLFEEVMDIAHCARAKKEQWSESPQEKDVTQVFYNLIHLCNDFHDKAFESNALISSVKTGLLVKMRKENKHKDGWTNGDLELAYLADKFSLVTPWRDGKKFPEQCPTPDDPNFSVAHKEWRERYRVWSKERNRNFHQKLASAVANSGMTLSYNGPGHYDWKILDEQGNDCVIRLVVPKDGRKKSKFVLQSKKNKDWIVGRMMYLNSNYDIEWKSTPKGPQADAGQIPQNMGQFVLFDYMEDRVLDPA
jgi:hypothetical protein